MSTGRQGAPLIIPMGPLVTDPDADVLSVNRLNSLGGAFQRGYMDQMQRAEARAKLPLIQAQAKVGVAQSKEQMAEMQDPERASLLQKQRKVLGGRMDAELKQQQADNTAFQKEFELRQAKTLFDISQLEQNKWRVNDMADFLTKEGVTFDFSPNDPPEVSAQKLRERINEYRQFVQWSASAKAEYAQLEKKTQKFSVGGENNAKKEYEKYIHVGPGGVVPEERVKELQLAQLLTFEQFSAYKKAFQQFAQPSAAAPPQPATDGAVAPAAPVAPVEPTAPVNPLATQVLAGPARQALAQEQAALPDLTGATLIGVTPPEVKDAPAETSRQIGALMEAPDMLRRIEAAWEENRRSGTVPYSFTIPGMKNDDGTPAKFDLAPITGLLANANAWDGSARALNQAVNAATSTFARGVFREVGVLSDADVARYKQLLPGANAPEGAAKLLFAILKDTLESSALMTSALHRNTNQGKQLAYVYGFNDDDLDRGLQMRNEIAIKERAARGGLATPPGGTPATATPAGPDFKSMGIQPPPPGFGVAPHPDNPDTLIYFDPNTGEWFPANRAQ